MVGIFLVLLGIVAYTPEVSYWNMVQSTQTYGYLNAFAGYAKKDLLSQKPPGYSVQKVKEILDQYQEDKAAAEPVDVFDRVDHKTVILMFGDHQPGLDSGIYDLIKGSGSEETAWQMYTVPFVLWGNFDLPYEDGQLTSPGYLRQILMETAGLPLDPYGQFLLSCREQYPAVNSFGYFETDGTWKQAEQMPDDGLLGQYRMLQYANTFDKKAKDYFGR